MPIRHEHRVQARIERPRQQSADAEFLGRLFLQIAPDAHRQERAQDHQRHKNDGLHQEDEEDAALLLAHFGGLGDRFLQGGNGDLAHQRIGRSHRVLEFPQGGDIGRFDAVDLIRQLLPDGFQPLEFGHQIVRGQQPLETRLEDGDAAVENVEILFDPLQVGLADRDIALVHRGSRQGPSQPQHQVLLIHLELRDDPAGVVAVGQMHVVQTPLKAEGADQKGNARHQKQPQKDTRRKARCPAEGLVQAGVEIRERGLAHSDNTFSLSSCQTLSAKYSSVL